MRKIIMFFGALTLILVIVVPSFALQIYVDAAPNVYGSPDYPDWQTAAYAAAAAGTFINMENSVNSANVGTTNFEIEDEVVYSFGDLGKRLTWVYWIPGETVDELSDRFQISLINVWDGETWDFYDYYYGSTWLTPTKWADYDKDDDQIVDGVIGTAGMAWWGAYGVNTPEALAQDLADWGSVSETWIFKAKLDGEVTSITCNRDAVPEPSTILLMGLGLLGLVGIGRRRRR